MAAVAVADHAPVYHAPAHAAHAYHAPAPKHHGGYHEPQYESTPPKYEYGYGVQDEYNHLNYGQNEARDGYSTYGEYHVQLPDGRLQTVKYTVGDAYSGYVADVSYSGHASYGPAPAKHAPEYHPAPAPKYHN